MFCAFAYLGTLLWMTVCDCCQQAWRGWVRLHKRCGGEHSPSYFLGLGVYLGGFVVAVSIERDNGGSLFDISARSTGLSHRVARSGPCRPIRRHTSRAGVKTRIGYHSLCATGISDPLNCNGSLAERHKLASLSDTSTTRFYVRRSGVASLDEYGTMRIL